MAVHPSFVSSPVIVYLALVSFYSNFSILLSVKIPSINVSFQLSMLRGIPLKERNEEIFFVRASIEKGNEIRVARVQLELRRESQIDSSG